MLSNSKVYNNNEQRYGSQGKEEHSVIIVNKDPSVQRPAQQAPPSPVKDTHLSP